MGPDSKPRWINSSVEEYIGYTVSECMAMPDFAGTVIHPADIARVIPEIQKGLRGIRGDDLEFRCVRKDGALIWLSVSWVPISDSRGNGIGFRTSGRTSPNANTPRPNFGSRRSHSTRWSR